VPTCVRLSFCGGVHGVWLLPWLLDRRCCFARVEVFRPRLVRLIASMLSCCLETATDVELIPRYGRDSTAHQPN